MTPIGVSIKRINFTAFAIQVKDDLTQQSILLTPAEAVQLRDMLNQLDLDDGNDPTGNRLAGIQKALTIYNGHSLPYVNREQYETSENVRPHHFDFELIQRMKDDDGIILETQSVGTL